MLQLKGIYKTFNAGTVNEKRAIDNLNLTLEDGDFVTIIGGNGAGKSTTLNLIAGVYPVDAGMIHLNGYDLTNLPEHRRARFLGRVFQDPMMGTAATMGIEENLALAYRRGQKRGLVKQVGQVGAGEARRAHGDHMQVDVRHERLALGVYLQNRLAAFQIRCFDGHLTVETTRAQQCRIEHIRTVGRSDDDEVRIVVEAVHLDEQLVQRLLALVVAASILTVTALTDGIDLINENNTWCHLLCLLKQITHSRCTYTDEHLYEIRSGKREKRNFCFAGHRLCKQCLTGSRRSD